MGAHGGRGKTPPDPPAPGELEGVRARDPKALEAFFDRYFDRLFGLALHLLGDRPAAEDIVQEVFLKVHRAAGSLEVARDPYPWLMTITTNLCRDLWRSGAYQSSHRGISLDDEGATAPELPSPLGNPESDLVTAEREALVRSALAELPENLRTAVVLHAYEGLGHEEAATLSGIGAAAQRKRYSRGLAELGRLLQERMR